MKRCEKCNVNVNSVRKTCPLCGQILKDEEKSEISFLYPEFLPKEKRINLAIRILLFLSITAIIVSIFINIIGDSEYLWSIYVVIGIAYAWILLRSTIMSRRNIAGRLLIQMLAVSLLCVIIERVSESSGWALEYVVPFVCIITTLAIVVLILSKQMLYNDYLLYLLVSILISFVPIIINWLDKVSVYWPSIAAAGVAIITTLGMIVFADRATKDELKKRFHL